MELYYKYFLSDKESEMFLKKNKDKIDNIEVADYRKLGENKINNIPTKYLNKNIMYHSKNKYFAFFVPYSTKETNLYKKQEQIWKRYWEEEFQFCNKISAQKIVIHFIKDTISNSKEIREYFYDNNKSYFKFLFNLSEKHNVKIYFENSYEKNEKEYEEIINFIDKKYDTDYGICFDIGHANVWGDVNSNIDNWIDYIMSTGKDIHLHLHTNDKTYDSHQSIFKNINNKGREAIKVGLKKLKSKGLLKNATLEVDKEFYIEDKEYLKNL